MADTPADPNEPPTPPVEHGRPVGDAPQPLPHTGLPEGGPAESMLAATPGSALAGMAQADPEAAKREISRQKFLSAATIGIGGVMGAVIAVPSLGFALSPIWRTASFDEVDLGPTSLYPVNPQKPYTTVTFERKPDDTTGLERRVAFIRNDGNDHFTAISNTCMHLGCPVRNFGNSFGCPCHGGQYDSEGRRIAGPPVRPLNRYDTKVVNGHLILGKLYAMDNKLHRHQLKGPGEYISGWLSFLYPPAPQ